MNRDYYQYFYYFNGRTVVLCHNPAKEEKVSDLAPLTITATATAQPPDCDRTARILAAAERLNQRLREYTQSMDSPSYTILEELLDDYANAKGEK